MNMRRYEVLVKIRDRVKAKMPDQTQYIMTGNGGSLRRLYDRLFVEINRELITGENKYDR